MSQHSFATSLRRRIAIVMAAMLALTLVPLAGPAGAQPAPAPDISTCDDAPDAGFTDTAGTGFATEIDCLAAFGVTTGTTATTYSPAVQVRRSQMALFYYRVGTAAGLTWDTSDAGFTDLAGLDADFVDAINALANAGIVQGTSATEFSPQDRIRRSQMALFIDRFQAEIDFAYSDGFTGDDLFPDISTLGAEARLAVNGIGSVGISQGDASGNYVPSGFVSRQQMAAFIVRHLVDNGFEVPGADVSGVIIEAWGTPGGDTDYIISTGDEIVEVEVGTDPSFSVSGVPATQAVFEGQATLGAMVAYNEDADSHAVTPVDEDEILATGYMVGSDLNTGTPEASLVEPYSGASLTGTPVDLDDDADSDPVYRVGNTTVDQDDFLDSISFGDMLTVENYDDGDADTDTIYRLFNGDITGGADVDGIGTLDETDPGTAFDMQVDTNGWIEYRDAPDAAMGASPLGNDLAGGTDFVLNPGDATQRFRVDGNPYTQPELAEWLNDQDPVTAPDFIRVTYTRSGNLETFNFTFVEGDADDDVEEGSVSGTFVAGSATNGAGPLPATLEIEDSEGTIWTVNTFGVILVDGTITSYEEIADGSVLAGASVTVVVGDDSTIDDTTNTVNALDPTEDLVLITNP